MITGFMESSLAQSKVFSGLNSNLKIKDKSVRLIQNSKHLTNNDIEAAYIQVKQITDSLTVEAVRAFETGTTVLVYNHEKKLSLTQAVPFITYNMKGRYVTYVFVDKYVNISARDGVMTMQPPVLRDLLIGAVISTGLKRNYELLASNQFMQKICSEIYNQFFIRIINREFSIAADKNIYETVQYYVKRFFLERVYGANNTPDNIDKMAKSHIKYSDELAIGQMKSTYDKEDPGDVEDLLNMFHDLSPRMKSADIGKFMNDWDVYYYDPALLAIDNMEYFLFMCVTLLSGNNIINVAASDIVKEAKGIKNFRGELLKIAKAS